MINPGPLFSQPLPIAKERTPGSAAEAYSIIDGYRKSWFANADALGFLQLYIMDEHPTTGHNYDAKMY